MRPLATALCTLEPLVAAHAPEMFEVLSDRAIYEFENAPPPSSAWLAERYARLERRQSADGSQIWLNWVIRLPSGELAGYVQATVLPTRTALIGYELASRFWRRGIGRAAVTAMLDELAAGYGATLFAAVLKATNHRSHALLHSLAFAPGTHAQRAEFHAAPDELAMIRAPWREAGDVA